MSEGVDAVEVVVVAEDPTRVTQAPSDVIRLVVGLLALLVVVLVGLFWGDGVVAFTSDLFRGLDQLPSWLDRDPGRVGAARCGPPARQRRGGGGAAALHPSPGRRRGGHDHRCGRGRAADLGHRCHGGQPGDDHPSRRDRPVGTWPSVLLAALTALFATVGPWTSRRWRRISWAGLICIGVTLFVASPVAFGTAIGLLSGWVAGTAVNVVGRLAVAPAQGGGHRRRPGRGGGAAGAPRAGEPRRPRLHAVLRRGPSVAPSCS